MFETKYIDCSKALCYDGFHRFSFSYQTVLLNVENLERNSSLLFDPHTPVIHQAALLHDFAEMLLWVHAPALALSIREAQRADPQLRSSEVQKRLLHIELADLQQSLMKTWRLPDMLTRISDDKHADHPSVRTVLLAIRVARHSAQGWDNPALPDDVNDIGELLQLSAESTRTLLHDIDR